MTTPLAPALGRLAAPPRGAPFDEVRLELVDRLLAARAAGPLDGAAWLEAWQGAARTLQGRVLDEAERNLVAAAARSRFPAARLALLRPDADSAETLLNRILAEGEALERLDGAAADDATTRARGAALEAAWDGAIAILTAERAQWLGVARDVEQWRRPWRPLVIVAVVSITLALIVAAMLGGWIATPAWLQPVHDWFWSLPWP